MENKVTQKSVQSTIFKDIDKKMKKPDKPAIKRPSRPKAPYCNEPISIGIFTCGRWDELTFSFKEINDMIKKANVSDLDSVVFQIFFEDNKYDYYADNSVNLKFKISYSKKNETYEEDLIQYKKKLSKYNKEIKLYNKTFGEYKKELNRYNKWKEARIAELEEKGEL